MHSTRVHPEPHQRPCNQPPLSDSPSKLTSPVYNRSNKAEATCPPSRSRWNFTIWTWYWISWIASLCFFIATIGVLRALDDQPLPRLRFGFRPNAIIGLLATFTELFLMLPVSAAIGQLKWLRALHPRSMDEFRLIEEASRGPWGSLQLISLQVGGTTSSFGAFITLLAIGISTFTQQALRYNTVHPFTEEARLPIAQSVKSSGIWLTGSGTYPIGFDPVMLPAPYAAFFNPLETDFTPRVKCNSGNCTWDSYQTLELCSTCENLSSKLRRDTQTVDIVSSEGETLSIETYSYSLPKSKLSLARSETWAGVLNLSTSLFWSVNETRSTTYFVDPSNTYLTMDILAIGVSNGSLPEQPNNSIVIQEKEMGSIFAPPVGYECRWQYCMRTKQATFVNATLREVIQSTYYPDLGKEIRKTGGNIITVNSPGSNDTFILNVDSASAVYSWLTPMLVGNSTIVHYKSGSHGGKKVVLHSSDITQAIYMAMNASDTGFPSLIDNLAKSLSLHLRMASYQTHSQGRMYTTTTKAVVHWVWLVLPAVEVLGSLAFFVIVLVESKKANMPFWANNVLATFFHGFDKRPLRRKGQDSDMEEEAKGLAMEFRPKEEGGRLVLVDKDVEKSRLL